jgi:hypothetical protein
MTLDNLEITKLVIQAGIAFASAYLAAYIATRKFRSEKWWERKANAYCELVDSLHQMSWYAEEFFEDRVGRKLISDIDLTEYGKQYRLARRNVAKISDTSAFLISSKAGDAVRLLIQKLEAASGDDDWTRRALDEGDAIRECLGAVKALASQDLGVHGHMYKILHFLGRARSAHPASTTS